VCGYPENGKFFNYLYIYNRHLQFVFRIYFNAVNIIQQLL
jgi:hypothetical protein